MGRLGRARPQTSSTPLIPITLLKELDAVIEPKEKRLTLRLTGSVTELEELESGHQTMLMTDFDADNGWFLPESVESEYITPNGVSPFLVRSRCR